MHFSTCSNSSVHSPSSKGDLSTRCLVLEPFPHVTLQSLHSDHGVSRHGIVSVTQVTQRVLERVSFTHLEGLHILCGIKNKDVKAKFILISAEKKKYLHFWSRKWATYDILASCTSPLPEPLPHKWSHLQEASSPCALSASCQDHRWHCRHPILPTL